jgi:hypothetical protein
MDPAYFLGRRQILQWMNNSFQMNVGKIEETASGESGLSFEFVAQRSLLARCLTAAPSEY